MKRNSCIILISLLVFSALQAKSSTIRSLKHETVKRIAFRHDTLLNLPQTSHGIGFVVFTEDGRITSSKGFLKGKLRSSSLKIEVENGHLFFGKLYIDKRNTDKNFNNVPFKFWSKYEPEKVFYDTLWLNTEKEIYILPIEYPKKKVPGSKLKFGVEVLYDNDQIVSYTSPTAFEKVLPEFDILLKGGSYNSGVFTISPDFFDYPDHHPGVGIQLRKDTSIYDIFDIEMDYIDQYYLSASGNSGMFGFSGSSGSSGSSSQNGNHGQDGQFGEHGTQGHDVDVYTDVYFDSILQKPLIKVFMEDLYTNRQKHYLINPAGGKLRIDASGGQGGSGGSGGSGGNGGEGYVGETYYETIKEIIIKKDTAGKEIREEKIIQIQRQRAGGNGGSGGNGGFGGVGGDGGAGGYVILNFTPAMKNYLHLITINVSGGWYGRGGSGGSNGNGGKGGQGNPNGRSGLNGKNGLNAPDGYSGNTGKVEYKTIDKIPW